MPGKIEILISNKTRLSMRKQSRQSLNRQQLSRKKKLILYFKKNVTPRKLIRTTLATTMILAYSTKKSVMLQLRRQNLIRQAKVRHFFFKQKKNKYHTY